MKKLYPMRWDNVIIFYWGKFDDNNITPITLILTSILKNLLFSLRGRDRNLYHLEFHIYITHFYKITLYNKLLYNIENRIVKTNNHKASWPRWNKLFMIIKNYTILKIEY